MGETTVRKRMGRPPLPDAERKEEVIHLRITAKEADFLYSQARKAGRSLSVYLRGLLAGLFVSTNAWPVDKKE